MTYELEIEINQPRAKVIELFDNPDNLAFWQPRFVSYEHESGEPGQPGAKATLNYRHGNRPMAMHETIIKRDLPDEFTGRFEIPGMMIMETQNLFTEEGPETTLWRTINHLTITGWMMKIMSFFMPDCSRKESWKFMQNFKAFAETGADVRVTGGAG